MSLNRILAEPVFAVIVVPLLLMLVGVFAKRLGRRDGDDSPQLNDWAVGTTTLLMCLGKIAADLPTDGDPNTLPAKLGWLILILFAVFVSIDHDRFRSWVRDDQGLPTKNKRPIVGVWGPDFVSFMLFSLYQGRNFIQ